jgi:doubled CXXCH motif protein
MQDSSGQDVYVDEKRQKASVHGVLACTDCHTSISDYPHPEHPRPVNCGTCHADEANDVGASVHASASAQPCLGCHGNQHEIQPVHDSHSPVYPLNVPRTCGFCHANPVLGKKYGLANVYSLYVDSIHGFALSRDGLLVAATCSSCHGTHKILSRKNPESRTYKANIPATCGSCHAGPESDYFSGVHGKALRDGNSIAPVCTDCHTAHQISRPQEAAWQLKTSATCGNCHRERLATYRDTFHAQVSALGYVEAAHCWDCHGIHQILPASDPQSPVARANLVATCGRCHTGASASFVSYQPHGNYRDRKSSPSLYFSALFMNVLLGGVLGFFALHTLLWGIRASFDRRKTVAAGKK